MKKRLFKPLDEPPAPDTWPVKLNWRVNKGDAILLAHILYDTYAELSAKRIYSHIEKDFSAGYTFSFLRATPWFTGEGQLYVAGIPLGNGKAFLALGILGSTQPGGETIQREKEQRGTAGEDKEANDWMGIPFKSQPSTPDIIDLTDDAEPDHGSSWLDISEEEFSVLGKPRKVVDRKRDRNGKRGARNLPIPGDETSFSAGEAYGTGKDIGKANLNSSLEMESQGMLRDMWEAFRHLHGKHPKHIKRVEWFTFENGFCANPEPKLIRLNPIEDDTSVPVSIFQWPFIDHEQQQLRGALIIQVISDTKYIYIVELQRKHTIPSSDSDETEEETMSGLCFVLNEDEKFDIWLRKLLSEIRYKKGIFKKIISRCPGHAETFVHRKSKSDSIFCESAAKNALKKMGLKL